MKSALVTPLTPRQAAFLELLIRNSTPGMNVVGICRLSVRAIAGLAGLSSPSSVQEQLNILERRGYISRPRLGWPSSSWKEIHILHRVAIVEESKHVKVRR